VLHPRFYEGVFYFILENYISVTNACYIYTNKKAMATEKKDHVTGRVSQKAVNNISSLASCFGWSFNQTLEFAMIHLNGEHILQAIRERQAEQIKQLKP
jgi:hypothetical protein